ncbi:MAG: M57 family metalloprotease [Saprospiraceae bacterium]
MKRLFFLLLFISTTLLVFVGCNTNETDVKPIESTYDEAEIQKIKDYISEYYGINKKDLEIQGDEIIFQEDIAFPIEGFWEIYGKTNDVSYGNQNLEKKHYRATLVSTPKPPRLIIINVLSSTPSSWSDALYDAKDEWNMLNGNVRFSVQSSSRGMAKAINIKGGDLRNSNTPARASLPYEGDPGLTITINTKGSYLKPEEKTKTMVHEIGHTIGFYHTDEGTGTLITNVSKSCKNNIDTASVMRQGRKSWVDFSPCDKQAFDALY